MQKGFRGAPRAFSVACECRLGRLSQSCNLIASRGPDDPESEHRRLAARPRREEPGRVRGGSRSLVLLDFADSIVGHPLLDMAAFLTRVRRLDVPAVREKWCAAWRAAIPGSDPERAADLLAPIAAARQAAIYQEASACRMPCYRARCPCGCSPRRASADPIGSHDRCRRMKRSGATPHSPGVSITVRLPTPARLSRLQARSRSGRGNRSSCG